MSKLTAGTYEKYNAKYSTLTLTDGEYALTVTPEKGGMATSFTKSGEEYLWLRDKNYESSDRPRCGVPILFPSCGKPDGGVHHFNGSDYPIEVHGFADLLPWQVKTAADDEIVLTLTPNGLTKFVYPFDFAFTVTQELSGRTLTITWNVENTGDDDMYFSVGGHPAFMIPEQYDIVFNKGLENHTETELEYVLIDPETAGVDVAHPRKLKLQDGRIPYTRTLFDEDALIFDNTQVERVGVEVDGKPYVTLTCKGFPSVGVWSKPKADAPFVCLEPWIGRCDNVGFDGELKDKYGEQHLKAGESFQASYTIAIGE